ncbi:hypothetical protein [Roseovarius nitratireducens]|uniref:hypothetical protein n=1 Tax=Roseovarius nitratireducens TaxID=2044597 RepID=UPI000CE25A1D|nr:hypothetical protein [Roseovarius nitratireducens]
MTGRRGMGRGWARGGAAVLLALILALRVAALPVVMAGGAPGPGMMAICTGAEIIYVPIGGGPAEPAPDAAHDPCPAFGITAALALPDIGVTVPAGRLVSLTPVPGQAARVAARPAPAHRPRAPPLA